MKLILSSFGIGKERSDSYSPLIFDRMPPAMFCRASQQFIPDYASLLVADSLVVDSSTLERLSRNRSPLFHKYKEVIGVLEGEGFAQVQDYSAIIHQEKSRIQDAVVADLQAQRELFAVLHDSNSAWLRVLNSMRGPYSADGKLSNDLKERADELSLFMHISKNRQHHIHSRTQKIAIHSMDLHKPLGEEETEALIPYLTYVNTNIALCERLDGSIYDWPDIIPFYSFKASQARASSISGNAASVALRKLFEITFPEISEIDLKSTLTLLRDKRVQSLRDTISKLMISEEEIDPAFVIQSLREVIGDERRASRRTKIISYATSPLGFIPVAGTPIQKAAEEAIDLAIRKLNPPRHPWYLMVSEAVDGTP